MSSPIALIDYGAGNLTSVKKALAAVGADFRAGRAGCAHRRTRRGRAGVGHFGATRALDRPWVDAILALVGDGKPLLGICLGMQWLFEGSEEAPECRGLGVLAGRCRRLSVAPGEGRLKIPHVGWNSLEPQLDASIIEGIPAGAQVYFTHSYVAPVTGDTVAATEHGERFASVVQRGQIAGVQFHPEKSGDIGLRILENWLALAA